MKGQREADHSTEGCIFWGNICYGVQENWGCWELSGPDRASIGREGSKARKVLKDQEQNGRKNGLQVFKRFPCGSQYLIKIST